MLSSLEAPSIGTSEEIMHGLLRRRDAPLSHTGPAGVREYVPCRFELSLPLSLRGVCRCDRARGPRIGLKSLPRRGAPMSMPVAFSDRLFQNKFSATGSLNEVYDLATILATQFRSGPIVRRGDLADSHVGEPSDRRVLRSVVRTSPWVCRYQRIWPAAFSPLY